MKQKNEYIAKKKKNAGKSYLLRIILMFLGWLFFAFIMCIFLGFSWAIEIQQDVDPPTAVPTLAPPEITPTPKPCDVNLAFQPVDHNQDWTPCEKEFDGVPMMLVPVGCYLNRGNDDATPIQVCYDEPFWIDKYEVMNKAFDNLTCVYWSTAPNQPYVCIELWDAESHCKSRGGNLPTEEHWEYAASGVDNWQYPWGDTWITENVHWNIQTSNIAEAVDSRPSGASWIGALHMSGNVWEWVHSMSAFPIARGGSFNSHSPELLTTSYRIRHGSYSGTGTGFRCIREFTKSDSN